MSASLPTALAWPGTGAVRGRSAMGLPDFWSMAFLARDRDLSVADGCDIFFDLLEPLPTTLNVLLPREAQSRRAFHPTLEFVGNARAFAVHKLPSCASWI